MLKWSEQDGQFVNDHDPDGALTVAEVRAIVRQNIDDYAERVRGRLVKNVSPVEAAMWLLKRNEALAAQASGQAADAPTLQAEAVWRGVTLASLVTRVLNNANAVIAVEAKIAGLAGKHKDAINNLNTRVELLAYDWREGF